jgi:hypothetical protein
MNMDRYYGFIAIYYRVIYDIVYIHRQLHLLEGSSEFKKEKQFSDQQNKTKKKKKKKKRKEKTQKRKRKRRECRRDSARPLSLPPFVGLQH